MASRLPSASRACGGAGGGGVANGLNLFGFGSKIGQPQNGTLVNETRTKTRPPGSLMLTHVHLGTPSWGEELEATQFAGRVITTSLDLTQNVGLCWEYSPNHLISGW